MDSNKCKHTVCTCPVSDGEDYCSVACRDAAPQHNHGDGCGCGHDGCAGRKDAAQVVTNA